MRKYDKLDVFMKILEIIEQDHEFHPGPVTDEQRMKIATVIHRIEGDFIVQQSQNKEVTVEGDKFENISQSVIATRGSIAKGIIGVREQGEEAAADALHALANALAQLQPAEIQEEQKSEALDILDEIGKQASQPTEARSITVLKALGASLLSVLKGVGALKDVVAEYWDALASLWA